MPQLMGWGKEQLWELKGLRWCWAANTTLMNPALIPAHSAQTCSHKAQQSLGMVYSGKWGCSPLEIAEAAARSLASWAWITLLVLLGKALQSEYYFCRADRNANSEIFLTQIFLTVLYTTNIFIITHVQKILHCCKTSPEQSQEISTELQWRKCINSGFLRAARLCVFSSENPPKAMIKISMKLCLNN